MVRWKTSGVVVALVLMALVWGGMALAQRAGGPQGRGGEGQQRGGRQSERGGFDRDRMRQMMMQRMQEMLGATDEEWTVIGPRLEKVMELSREARGGFRGRMFGGTRRRPGGDEGRDDDRRRPGQENEEEDQTAVEKAAEALQQTLSEEGAAPATVKARLTEYRRAREQARQALAKAQAELRSVLTMRQEAQLVLMGQID